MISWKENVKMRALKEELISAPSLVAMPADFYQQAQELALKSLNELERKALFLRFWEPLPIARVADLLGFTWEYTDSLIDRAVTKLRGEMSRLLAERQRKQSFGEGL
jgi:DNA-directed RNA polymerase specialized sigma24 family protein